MPADERPAHLEETFYVLSKKSTVFRVRLDDDGLSLRRDGDAGKPQTIAVRDMVGCKCVRGAAAGPACACTSLRRRNQDKDDSEDGDPSAYLHVYAYKLKRGIRGDCRRRTALTLRFRSFDRFDDNNREALKWKAAIKCLIEGRPVDPTPLPPRLPQDERRLLVLLNPKSGTGKAREIFQRSVSPVFFEAEIPYDLQVTKRANFAREFVRKHNLYNWRGIVAVGGDGILYEVLNGIFERPDWKQVLDEVPFGIVPCGSGNGLARTLCHLFNEPYSRNPVMANTLAIVRGQTNAMDIVRVETKTQILFSFLSVGWGLLSDIDIESERLRIIGGQRFTIWSLARLIGLRTYRGKLYYVPTSVPVTSPIKTQAFLNHSFSQDGVSDCLDCYNLGDDCENCRVNANISLDSAPDEIREPRGRLDSWYSATSKKSAYFSTVGSDYMSIVENRLSGGNPEEQVRVYGPASRLPALTAAPPPSWKVIEGDFILVHAGYQPYLGEDFIFAPESRLDDGVIWLLIIKGGATRTQLLTFLWGLASGAHAVENNNDKLQLIPVSAFRIEPEPDPSHPAHITVDGELVTYGPVQGEICSVQARVMVPSNKY